MDPSSRVMAWPSWPSTEGGTPGALPQLRADRPLHADTAAGYRYRHPNLKGRMAPSSYRAGLALAFLFWVSPARAQQRPAALLDSARAIVAQSLRPVDATIPLAPPPPWLEYIGEYGSALDPVAVLEHAGVLQLLIGGVTLQPLTPAGRDSMRTADGSVAAFRRTAGNVTSLELDNAALTRRPLGPDDGNVFRITPRHGMAELERMAAAATPPVETGDFASSDLVELRSLDPSIRYDIRYATTDNFMGAVFYSQPRAFLQRPAAEALVRAGAALRERGYGLLIHDAYRPWYVTKMFWDATPDSLRKFVANPANGSRHNRGAAVDLSLYDLQTGEPVIMVSGYDEFSPRAYPDYAGGTSRQRWLRALLRTALEAEGFTVNPNEWWHFDYRDWRRYRIGTERFEQLAR